MSDFWKNVACSHAEVTDHDAYGQAVCVACGRIVVVKLTGPLVARTIRQVRDAEER